MTITDTRPCRRLAGLRLRQFQISSITDADTITTGIANAKVVAVRSIAAAAGATTSIGASTTPWDGALTANRRHQARITTQDTGIVTYDVGTNGGTSTLMVWG